MKDGVSICFIRTFQLTNINKNFFTASETFSAPIHLTYQYHFEDTPREAVKAKTLAASLLYSYFFSVGMTSYLMLPEASVNDGAK